MNPLTMPPSAGINEDAGAPATRGRERTVAHPMQAAMERAGAVSRDERAGGLPSPAPQRRVVTKRRGLTIGYVVDRFPRAPHDFVFQEILELQSLGIEVNVFSLDMPDGRIDDTAIALARLEHPVRYFAADAESTLAPIRPVLDPDATRKELAARQAEWLASQIEAMHIDHLHAHAATAPIDVAKEAARLTAVGYSFTARADGLDADGPSLRERIATARFVVTSTDFERGHLLRLCGSEVARKLHRVAVGIDPKEYRFSEPECHDSNSVLATGPLVPESGFGDLIDAVAILRARGRTVRLTIVGEGELEETLRARIDSEGLDHVQVLSSASRGQLAMLMRMHTAVVVPWVGDAGDHDAFAHVVLEAMAVGAVVLSTDRPGLRELIDDGLTGRVITPADPVGLAGALETLFEYKDLRERMASRARAKVERRFTAARNVSHLAGLFMDAVVKNGLPKA